MEFSSAHTAPRWALVIFDSDGCTLVTRTSNLCISDDESIEVGQVLRFRHGRDVYLVEVLTLADTKAELNDFERDWQVTGRSEAIHSAKSCEQVGNFLKIGFTACQSDAVQVSADFGNLTDRLQTRTDLESDVERLAKNQEKILANQDVMMEAIVSIKDFLSTRMKKSKVEPAFPTETQQVVGPIPPPAKVLCIPKPMVIETIEPVVIETTEPVVIETTEPVVIETTEPMIEEAIASEEFDLEDGILLSYEQPEQLSLQDFFIPEMTDTVTTPLQQTPTFTQQIVTPPVIPSVNTLKCVRQLEFNCNSRPAVNIGTIRNPVIVDSVKYERAKTLPTVQRYILSVMDLVFTGEEMANSTILGGTVRQNGQDIVRQSLCNLKLSAIFYQAAFLFDRNADTLKADIAIRNAINSKCRTKRSKQRNVNI